MLHNKFNLYIPSQVYIQHISEMKPVGFVFIMLLLDEQLLIS